MAYFSTVAFGLGLDRRQHRITALFSDGAVADHERLWGTAGLVTDPKHVAASAVLREHFRTPVNLLTFRPEQLVRIQPEPTLTTLAAQIPAKLDVHLKR